MANESMKTRVAIVLVGVAFILGAAPAFAQLASERPVTRDTSRELACGPEAVLVAPAPSFRIVRGEQPNKMLFGTGEAVIISGGSAQGVRVGQDYAIRRVVNDQFTMPVYGFTTISIRTAGRLRIVEVERDVSIGTVAYACDGVLSGDYLEPYVRPVEPAPLAAGQPDYENTGMIILGNERRQTGGAGDMMVLDRGSTHGVRPGQRLFIFRDTLPGGPVLRIGEATAVIVRPDTTVVRIEKSRDAVYVGDRVALSR